jgi:hypothetical protein
MPQMILPIFPKGTTHITTELTFEKRDGRVTYFHGLLPVFTHDAEDIKSFRMITAQFCINGSAKLVEIERAFGVPANSVKRAVKLYREKGPKGFFAPRKARGAAVLTPPVLAEAQEKLDEGMEPPEIADKLGIKRDTLRKAILHGRLHRPSKKKEMFQQAWK